MDQITGRLSAAGNITGTLNGAGGGGGGATSLTQLTDVNISNPSNGQGLLYNSETSKWVNGSLPTGVDELSELSDVQLDTPVEGQLLKYVNGKWVNVDIDDILPIHDYLLNMTMTQQGATGSILVDDLADVLIDIHFSVSLMCPNSIIGEWEEQSDKWRLTVSVPYYDNVSTFYCVISLRHREVV